MSTMHGQTHIKFTCQSLEKVTYITGLGVDGRQCVLSPVLVKWLLFLWLNWFCVVVFINSFLYNIHLSCT